MRYLGNRCNQSVMWVLQAYCYWCRLAAELGDPGVCVLTGLRRRVRVVRESALGRGRGGGPAV